MQHDLELVQLGKVYPNGTPAVIDFDLQVAKGEFISAVQLTVALADGQQVTVESYASRYPQGWAPETVALGWDPADATVIAVQ